MTLNSEFWRVYNYVARRWYETEYGKVEQSDRWYHPAMIFLERRKVELDAQISGRIVPIGSSFKVIVNNEIVAIRPDLDSAEKCLADILGNYGKQLPISQ